MLAAIGAGVVLSIGGDSNWRAETVEDKTYEPGRAELIVNARRLAAAQLLHGEASGLFSAFGIAKKFRVLSTIEASEMKPIELGLPPDAGPQHRQSGSVRRPIRVTDAKKARWLCGPQARARRTEPRWEPTPRWDPGRLQYA